MKKNLKKVIDQILYDEMNEVSTLLHKEYKKISEESVASGRLNSGTYVTLVIKMIENKFIESCFNILDEIVNLQDQLNFTYSKNDLLYIKELIKKSYCNYINKVFDIEIIHGAFSVPNYDLNKVTIETTKKLLISKIEYNIENTLEDDKTKRSITKDTKAIKQAKIANVIAIFALIVSIISIFITLYFYYIQQINNTVV